MISLLEHAESVPRKEEFIEYLRCFTGYDEHAEKRSEEECKEIYTDFENKYNEKMSYNEFADIYFWEFVRQRQNGTVALSKQVLADLIENAYMEGKRCGR